MSAYNLACHVFSSFFFLLFILGSKADRCLPLSILCGMGGCRGPRRSYVYASTIPDSWIQCTISMKQTDSNCLFIIILSSSIPITNDIGMLAFLKDALADTDG